MRSVSSRSRCSTKGAEEHGNFQLPLAIETLGPINAERRRFISELGHRTKARKAAALQHDGLHIVLLSKADK
jgi:hypothetical protein